MAAVQQAPTDPSVNPDESPPPPASSKRRLLLIGGIVAAALAVAGGATTWYFVGAGASDAAAEQDATAAPLHKPALYLNLRPDFIVNSTAVGQRRYLQTNIVVMSRDQAVIDALNAHAPVVRSGLINLLADQDFMVLQTDAGKQALREQMRAAIDATLTKEAQVSGVEAVLFSSFVMQ